MTWLKLTTKSLYLMDSNSNQYLEKVDLKEHNPALQEFKLSMPLEWFQGNSAPGEMSIELNPSLPEPDPATRPNVLNVFDKVITTNKWGARDARDVSASPFPRTNPRFIVVHHTDHGDEKLKGADINPPKDTSGGTQSGGEALARRFQREHIDDNHWADSGHNFLNTTGGFLLEGRHGSLRAIIEGQCVESAHARQENNGLAGGNESPGIENEGNFMTFPMIQTQWDSLVDLCVGICKSCDIDPSQIRGHKDFSVDATDCPGDWLYSQLDRLSAEVRAKLS